MCKYCAYIVSFLAISAGLLNILGIKNKWQIFVDPKKDSPNPIEHSLFLSKEIFGEETHKIFTLAGGVISILFGLFVLVVEIF